MLKYIGYLKLWIILKLSKYKTLSLFINNKFMFCTTFHFYFVYLLTTLYMYII